MVSGRKKSGLGGLYKKFRIGWVVMYRARPEHEPARRIFPGLFSGFWKKAFELPRAGGKSGLRAWAGPDISLLASAPWELSARSAAVALCRQLNHYELANQLSLAQCSTPIFRLDSSLIKVERGFLTSKLKRKLRGLKTTRRTKNNFVDQWQFWGPMTILRTTPTGWGWQYDNEVMCYW